MLYAHIYYLDIHQLYIRITYKGNETNNNGLSSKFYANKNLFSRFQITNHQFRSLFSGIGGS